MSVASGLIRFIFLSLNSLVAFLLLLSAYSINIDPADFVLPAFLGLAFPLFLVLNLVFIILWMVFKKRFLFISLVAIILTYPAIANLFQLNLNNSSQNDTIKIMSYNVRLFDLYNWSENKSTRDKIFDQLSGQQADIYCFQEFYYTEQKGMFETKDTMLTFLEAKNYREAYTHKMRGEQYFGIATFTRFPIFDSGIIKFDNDDNNICLYTDLIINEDSIRVYNLHIASIRFSYDDYKFVENIDTKSHADELEKGAKTIYKRLADAFVKRSEQSKVIIKHVKSSPYPVILCGDFNDSPNSFCYKQFSDQLSDSFKEAGNGIGKTYIGSFPSFRIDYIFHDESFRAIDYVTLPEKFSDHHAVVTKVVMK